MSRNKNTTYSVVKNRNTRFPLHTQSIERAGKHHTRFRVRRADSKASILHQTRLQNQEKTKCTLKYAFCHLCFCVFFLKTSHKISSKNVFIVPCCDIFTNSLRTTFKTKFKKIIFSGMCNICFCKCSTEFLQ